MRLAARFRSAGRWRGRFGPPRANEQDVRAALRVLELQMAAAGSSSTRLLQVCVLDHASEGFE